MNNKITTEGMWLVDKPAGITSFGLVARVRRMSGIKKVGHAGTLDPLATGLMIILVGQQFTRQADKFLKLDKVYEVEMKLGETSSTGDGEGVITKLSDRSLSLKEVEQVLQRFTGNIMQRPPQFSAIKINGQPAYKLARAGQYVDIKPRPVTIYALEHISYTYPILKFSVKVSSGTYIRSLVADVGQALGSGAYLTKLRRVAIGSYTINRAIKLD